VSHTKTGGQTRFGEVIKKIRNLVPATFVADLNFDKLPLGARNQLGLKEGYQARKMLATPGLVIRDSVCT